MLAISTPDLMMELAAALEYRCKMRYAVVWLLDHFAGGLIHHVVVISPGCNVLASSTAFRSSCASGSNMVGKNSTSVG